MAGNDEKWNDKLEEATSGSEEPHIQEQLEKRRLAKKQQDSRNEPLPDLDDDPHPGPDNDPDGETPLPSAAPAAAEPEEKPQPPASEPEPSVQPPRDPRTQRKIDEFHRERAQKEAEEAKHGIGDDVRRHDHVTGVPRISEKERREIKHRPKLTAYEQAQEETKRRKESGRWGEGNDPGDQTPDIER